MEGQSNSMANLAEPARRAGTVVAEHVNSVIDAAEHQAHEVLRDAERDAEATRREALESAARVFERIDQLERPLREFIQNLRLETDRVERELAGEVDVDATPLPSESENEKALSEGGAEAVERPVEAVREPADAVSRPVEEPFGERDEEPAEDPIPDSLEEPVGRPVAEPVGKLEEEPVIEPVERPLDEPFEQKPPGKGVSGKNGVAEKPGARRSAGKKSASKRSRGMKPRDQAGEDPATRAEEGRVATASSPGGRMRERGDPAPKPAGKRSLDAERVSGKNDERAAEEPATSSTSPVVGTDSVEATEPRPTLSPMEGSGPAKLASRLLGRLRDGGAGKSVFITTEGHCAVCQKALLAGSEDELRSSGWKVSGDVGLCPECQSDSWQLPEGARLPFRRGGG